MLRKMSRSVMTDQNMDAPKTDRKSFESLHAYKNTNNSVFTVASMFLGQGHKALSDCDLVMSPTSPLDFIKFSDPFRSRISWDPSSKVGFSLIDALNNNSPLVVESSKNQYMPASDGKNIIFGPQLRIKLSNSGSHFDDHQLISLNKIKNPGTSIFEIADALEPECGKELGSRYFGSRRPFSNVSYFHASSHFLSFCYSCSKDLSGEDIYIYRGEKSFCSPICREMEILDDKEMVESDNIKPGSKNTDDQEPK